MAMLSTTQLRSAAQRIRAFPGNELVLGEIQAKLNSITPDADVFVDSWPNFRALVVKQKSEEPKLQHIRNNISVFATDQDALQSMLMLPDIADWSKDLFFPGVNIACMPTIKLIAEKMNFPLRIIKVLTLKTTNENLKISPIPDGLIVTSLQPEQSDIVNSTWRYSQGEKTNLLIKHMISILPSCALYDKDKTLLGFAISLHYGGLGMLHVSKKYRCKGYGKLVMSHLAAKWLQSGQDFFVEVVEGNQASIKLHLAIGFHVVPGDCRIYLESLQHPTG